MDDGGPVGTIPELPSVVSDEELGIDLPWRLRRQEIGYPPRQHESLHDYLLSAARTLGASREQMWSAAGLEPQQLHLSADELAASVTYAQRGLLAHSLGLTDRQLYRMLTPPRATMTSRSLAASRRRIHKAEVALARDLVKACTNRGFDREYDIAFIAMNALAANFALLGLGDPLRRTWSMETAENIGECSDIVYTALRHLADAEDLLDEIGPMLEWLPGLDEDDAHLALTGCMEVLAEVDLDPLANPAMGGADLLTEVLDEILPPPPRPYYLAPELLFNMQLETYGQTWPLCDLDSEGKIQWRRVLLRALHAVSSVVHSHRAPGAFLQARI